jgi:ABC-2 type transport system ATP-binding protein
MPPSQGKVRVFGKDPRDARARVAIGAMLQSGGGPSTLKVRELIELFSSYYPRPLPMATVLERADLIGLEERYLGRMSGGEQKRVRFALAICGDPRLLYLDEPTANLDVPARRKLYACIREQAVAGKSIVLATHHLEEADELATRVVLLNKGRVLRDGTVASIKGEVALQRASCRTRITLEEAARIPGVREAARVGERLDLRVDAGVAIASELYRRDPELAELTVERIGLEDAFVALVGKDR